MIASKMGSKTPVEKHFDEVASKYDYYTKKRGLHYTTLKKLLSTLIPGGKRVFEVGCGTGDLLASLDPKVGYGMDISGEMIKIAASKHKALENLNFSTGWPKGKYDYIYMCDVIEHLENPEETFGKISELMDANTLFINTMMNPIWIPVEEVYNFFGWKMPEGPHNRIKYSELKVMIQESGMKIIGHDYTLLMPIRIPFVTSFVNRYMEKFFKKLAFIEYLVAVKK
jgi:ubiquinone/menaquinone biosynthesis C-methylase UbiE